MIILDEIQNESIFNLDELKVFLKKCKDTKYECYFKLILAYQLSKLELVNLEWKDINFENNTITICPISYERNDKFYYSWKIEKLTQYARTYPLLPNLRKLLIIEYERQQHNKYTKENYDTSNQNYVCLKDDGTRLNYNTLSRNLRYIARDNNLPEILLDGLKKSLDGFIIKYNDEYNFYLAWIRYDCMTKKRTNKYQNFNLAKNKRFLNKLNNLLEYANERKTSMEMWWIQLNNKNKELTNVSSFFIKKLERRTKWI